MKKETCLETVRSSVASLFQNRGGGRNPLDKTLLRLEHLEERMLLTVDSGLALYTCITYDEHCAIYGESALTGNESSNFQHTMEEMGNLTTSEPEIGEEIFESLLAFESEEYDATLDFLDEAELANLSTSQDFGTVHALEISDDWTSENLDDGEIMLMQQSGGSGGNDNSGGSIDNLSVSFYPNGTPIGEESGETVLMWGDSIRIDYYGSGGGTADIQVTITGTAAAEDYTVTSTTVTVSAAYCYTGTYVIDTAASVFAYKDPETIIVTFSAPANCTISGDSSFTFRMASPMELISTYDADNGNLKTHNADTWNNILIPTQYRTSVGVVLFSLNCHKAFDVKYSFETPDSSDASYFSIDNDGTIRLKKAGVEDLLFKFNVKVEYDNGIFNGVFDLGYFEGMFL